MRSGNRSRYEPLWAFSVTCFTGQPKLMSTTLTRNSCASRAPTSASVSGSLSHICTASGRGSSVTPHSRSGCSASCSSSHTKPRALDHLGRLQAGAAELAHDLPKGVVREARHRRLQNRRIDQQRADPQRPRHGFGAAQRHRSHKSGTVEWRRCRVVGKRAHKFLYFFISHQRRSTNTENLARPFWSTCARIEALPAAGIRPGWPGYVAGYSFGETSSDRSCTAQGLRCGRQAESPNYRLWTGPC